VDAKEIRELIELLSRSNFASFELEREGFKLKLVKETAAGAPVTVVAQPSPAATPPVVLAAGPAAAQAEAAPEPVADGLVDVHSPIVGTFYSASSPEATPFVEIGSRISKGQVVCIVEAMKVMNEIEAELDAEVVEILVDSGQPVEYGEVLFRVRPAG
jgi:acetyl-CoA carboxylase biotin carboxyl carrier protein